MQLYHFPFSSNARKATMTAILLDLPVELVLVDLAQGAQRKPEFLKLNPNGKVPVLVDGNLTLSESLAICIYLAEKKPGNTLYPAAPAARADVLRWMFWSASHFTPAISTLNLENMLKKRFGTGEPDPVLVHRAEQQLLDLGKILDDHLAGQTWISGNAVTLADLAVGCPLMTMTLAKLPLQGFPNILLWFARLQALDAWKRTNPS